MWSATIFIKSKYLKSEFLTTYFYPFDFELIVVAYCSTQTYYIVWVVQTHFWDKIWESIKDKKGVH